MYKQKLSFVWSRKTTEIMGKVHADIELLNGIDMINVESNAIGEDEVRRFSIRSLVDTGSQYLCINEIIQQVLNLPLMERRRVQLADGQPMTCDVVGPVVLKFKNRTVFGVKAIVLPGDAEPLLGLLPLEEMDVIIDPNCSELLINPEHPDYAVVRI